LTEAPAVDASSLILLVRTAYLHLLKSLAPQLVVPEPVLEEIRAKGVEDATLQAVEKASPWLSVVQVSSEQERVGGLTLGKGEAAVLAWALSHPGAFAVLDDQRARSHALSLQIPVIGTLGVVLRAKRLGMIPLARPVVESLVAKGMYLSRSVVEKALALARE
jgi:predicted nucleic acid-binding protein